MYWNNCGAILEDLRRHRQAIDAFQSAVGYSPHDPVVDELSNPANGFTLAEAITEPNRRPGHDTITFSGGLDLSSAVVRVGSPALDAGSDGLAVSNLPRSSAVAYDRSGRKATVTQTDPDGIGILGIA